jgi:hypothetical protein
MKDPLPDPSVVLVLAVVGFWAVLQQTPRAVTSEPPLFVTLPPDAAVVAVIPETSAVLTSGNVLLWQNFKTEVSPIARKVINVIFRIRFIEVCTI